MINTRPYALALMLCPSVLWAQQPNGCDATGPTTLRVDHGHPWRPPFGLDRVGALPVVHVELAAKETPIADYSVVAIRKGEELEHRRLELRRDPGMYGSTAGKGRWFAHEPLTTVPTEVVLRVRCAEHTQDLVRQAVKWPNFEADATARSDRRINPIDLGTVLVPNGWLMLADGQAAVLELAVLSRDRDLPRATLRASFGGQKPIDVSWPLTRNQKATKDLTLPFSGKGDSVTLNVSLTDGEKELWRKEIRTILMGKAPTWPSFGAIETKLRYDPPIPVIDPKTGTKSTIDYARGWDEKVNDVVVFLPNGSRFVFWRGASFCPFWAGVANTGVNYQWAEHHSPGFVDSAEPLMDKELRYQQVKIIESTPSRVHVRWSYESVDFNYQRWGDHATEDFYFYPDGFGTRVVTLTARPEADYELLEFLILTPQGALPLDVLPAQLIDVLSLDGTKQQLRFPLSSGPDEYSGWPQRPVANSSGKPLMYRIVAAKDDPAAAIAFNPTDTTLPPRGFPAMYDAAELVAPAYWGSHWPLARGRLTTWSINDGLYTNPAHLTFLHWGLGNYRPKPIATDEFPLVDALGRSRPQLIQRWVWLIAKTQEADEVLRDWGHSFSAPPSLELTGAHLDTPSYSPERRALRLSVDSSTVQIVIKPAVHTVNPVFELDGAPRNLLQVTLDEQALSKDDYAWDGRTLWIRANIGATGASITLHFASTGLKIP